MVYFGFSTENITVLAEKNINKNNHTTDNSKRIVKNTLECTLYNKKIIVSIFRVD